MTRGFTIPSLSFIGAVSYSWYLYHGGIGYPLMAALEAPPYGLSRIVTTVLATGLTLVIAWISYRFVERPAIETGRQIEATWLARMSDGFGWRRQK